MMVAEAPPEWRKSAARDYLFESVLDGTIPGKDSKIGPREVFEKYCKDRPEFKDFLDYSEFPGRLRAARRRAAKKTDRATEDAEFFAHDRKIFPERTHDLKGEPKWQGSRAQELLQKDINEELKKPEEQRTKPRFLHASRDEYEEYALENFRKRIYQEIKAAKRLAYMEVKAAEKAEKKKNMKKNG